MNRLLVVCVLCLIFSMPEGLSAQQVVVYPGQVPGLTARWAWAEAQGGQARGGYWIGYSIRRMMGERSAMGRWVDGREQAGSTLEDLIRGRHSSGAAVPVSEQVRREAVRVLDDLDTPDRIERRVWKDVALLFFCQRGARRPSDLRIINLSLHVDLEGSPLYWLGAAADGESLSLVQGLYARAEGPGEKGELLTAVGIHQSPEKVVPFLQSVLTGREDDEVREKAAFWMGQQDDLGALRLLVEAAREDRSTGVREQAVFALSQVNLPEATDALIDLARNEADRKVRKNAVFWLGQKASRKAVETLQDFVAEEGDREMQKQAVFALSQLPDDQATPILIDVAKTHANPVVRKQAIFWLGQSEDSRALDVLVELVQGH